jgi:hypothetical protein
MRRFILNHLPWAAICLALLAGVERVEAVPIDFDGLSVSQGFNFNTSSQSQVGYITSLSIGSTNFAADFTVKNPTNSTANIQVVAVLSAEDWAGGVGDPLDFQGRLSDENRLKLANLIAELSQQGQTGPPVQFNFLIYAYDSSGQEYFEAFEPANNTAISGFVALSGGNDFLSVATTASTDVTSPVNYVFNIHIAPSGSEQVVIDSTSPSLKVAKEWGGLEIQPPAVTTLGASQITGSGATLRSTVNPGGAGTSAYFEYGTSPTLATKSTSGTSNPGSGNSGVPVSIVVSNLAPQTTYYYRIVGSNSQGRTPGNILSFNAVTPQFNLTNYVLTNGTFGFNFANASNAAFTVWGTTNLLLAITNWTAAGVPAEITPGQYHFTASATNRLQFYRLTSP